MKNLKKGFTLIELLVVVAIIGILASVVLASLNTARAKGANAAIKANLANIRAQAEIVYDATVPNGYGTASNASSCVSFTVASLFDNVTIKSAVAAALKSSGSTVGFCGSTKDAWVASIPLKASTGEDAYWCVDSTGVSAGRAATITSGVACPAAS